MATVVLIVVATVLFLAFVAAFLVQQRRNSDQPFGRDEADANSAHQQRERQGFS